VTALAVTPRVVAELRGLDVDLPDAADQQTIIARLEQRIVRDSGPMGAIERGAAPPTMRSLVGFPGPHQGG
jgi:hypothetical protein